MGIGAFSRSHVAHVQSATATTITDTTVTVTTITMTSQMLCFLMDGNGWEDVVFLDVNHITLW